MKVGKASQGTTSHSSNIQQCSRSIAWTIVASIACRSLSERTGSTLRNGDSSMLTTPLPQLSDVRKRRTSEGFSGSSVLIEL